MGDGGPEIGDGLGSRCVVCGGLVGSLLAFLGWFSGGGGMGEGEAG